MNESCLSESGTIFPLNFASFRFFHHHRQSPIIVYLRLLYHSSGFSFKTYYLTSSRIHTTTHLILCLTIFTLNDNLLNSYSGASNLLVTGLEPPSIIILNNLSDLTQCS